MKIKIINQQKALTKKHNKHKRNMTNHKNKEQIKQKKFLKFLKNLEISSCFISSKTIYLYHFSVSRMTEIIKYFF